MAENRGGFDRGNETVNRETGRKEQQRTEQIERGIPYDGHNKDQNKDRSVSIGHPIGERHGS